VKNSEQEGKWCLLYLKLRKKCTTTERYSRLASIESINKRREKAAKPRGCMRERRRLERKVSGQWFGGTMPRRSDSKYPKEGG